MTLYIGIDLGTTGCKTVMYAKDGSVLCEYNKEYDLIFNGSYVEQDANLWYLLVCDGMNHVVTETGIREIYGVSVSTQSISFVPVDKDGATLANAVSWLDMRAETERSMIENRFGSEKIFALTGKACLADYSLPKIMWMIAHKKHIFEHTYKILFPLDFLNLRLCGRAITDYTVAGGTMMYDIHNKCWSREILDFAGIPLHMLPEVGCMGEMIGELLPTVCEATGILPGCHVFLGGQDQKLAAIGAGIDKDSISVSFGTATAVSKLCDTADGASLFRFDNDTYISEIAIMTTGAALRWLSKTMYGGLSYREMDMLCEESCPGANGVQFDTDLSVGGKISGITLSTSKSDIIYALYEGVSRDIACAVAALGGAKRLLVFGGGSKSDIWCRILARVSGVETCIMDTPETASLGAAILASGGMLKSSAVKRTITPGY